MQGTGYKLFGGASGAGPQLGRKPHAKFTPNARELRAEQVKQHSKATSKSATIRLRIADPHAEEEMKGERSNKSKKGKVKF